MPIESNPGTSNFAKYATTNPIMRFVIQRFLRRITAEVSQLRPAQIIDVGCGEGLVAHELQKLPLPIDYRGFELNPLAVEAARALNPGLSFSQADLFQLDLQAEPADLVMMLEVLEHLDRPDLAVARLASWTRRAGLFSVPWEPWFRIGNFARGKYLKRLGNHPEHVQQFDHRSFHALLAPHFAEVHVFSCFPWLIGIVQNPRQGPRA